MLPADWLISTSHDTFALQYSFYGERCYGIIIILAEDIGQALRNNHVSK